jgi:hypothetical protein
MKQILVIVCALVAGFLGGLWGGHFAPGIRGSESVIRARKFELVDSSGKAISIWGVNRQGHTLLAFLGELDPSIPAEDVPPGAGLDNGMMQRLAIGVEGDRPLLDFGGADGKSRLELGLNSWYQPFMVMNDETSLRVHLGPSGVDAPMVRGENWALSFNTNTLDPTRVWIGAISRKKGSENYVRGVLRIDQNEVKYPAPAPK